MNAQLNNVVKFENIAIHCAGCNISKPSSDFYRRKKSKGKYQCKECEKKKNRIYQSRLRKNSPERIREYQERFKNGETKTSPVKSSPPKHGFKNNPVWAKNRHYKKNFGISLLDVKKMLGAQMGLCANRACGKPLLLKTKKRGDVANVDHCHTTGLVRGILCNRCNMACGILENKNLVLGLVEYLQKSEGNK